MERAENIDLPALESLKIEPPRYRSGRIRWGVFAQDSDSFESFVIQQVQELISDEVSFSHLNLLKLGRSDLTHAIIRYFPNGFSGVAERLQLEGRNVPPGYWMDEERIRVEARRAQEQGVPITGPKLYEAGFGNLRSAIQKYYPGSWHKLREDLGVPSRYKPRGYWTVEKIVSEALDFYQQNGDLSYGKLQVARKSSLAAAIVKDYPGGLEQLKDDFKIPASQRPRGYFNDPVNIEAEARKIIKETGELSSKAVHERGLNKSFGKYPGGIKALKQKFGIATPKPHNYWNKERIEQDLEAIKDEHGTLNEALLREAGRSDLSHAIQRVYPGGWHGVYQWFGIEVDRFPRNTWSQAEIERQAKEFYETNGFISEKALRKSGYGGLASAMRNYPGRWDAIREFLGISLEDIISSDDANMQLEKLLEDPNG